MQQLTIVFAVSFLMHWKILLGATICMDGWILENWKLNSSPESKNFFKSAGIPLVGYLHSRINPGKYSQQKYGFAIVCSIALSNAAFLGILQNVQPNNTNMNYILTSLFVTYSGKQMAIDMIVGLQYIFTYSIYLFAIFILTNPFILGSLSRSLLLVLVFPLLIVAFSTKSLLFTHVVASSLSLLFLVLKESEFYLVLLALANIALPIAYWIVVERVFPRTGNYSNYNNFLELHPRNLIKILLSLQQSFIEGVLNPLRRPIELVIKKNIVMGIMFPLVIMQQSTFQISQNARELKSLLFVGVCLFIAWAFPYVAVNQEFDYNGYLTKNNLAADLSFTFIAYVVLFLTGNRLGITLTICHLIASISVVQEKYNEAIRDYLKNRDLQNLFKIKFSDYKGEVVFIDESQWRLLGKKSKLYPMTLFYMLNRSEVIASVLPSNHYVSKPGIYGQNHQIFSELELPFNKSVLGDIPMKTLTISISDKLQPTQLNTYRVYLRYLSSRIRNQGSLPLGIIELTLISESRK